MACGDEGIDFDPDSDFDPDKPSTPRTLNNVVSDKRGPQAAERPDLSEKKLYRTRQKAIAHVIVNVHVLVLGSWALTVIPAHAGIQKGRRYTLQGRVGFF